jgi:hypothetical protein
MFGMPSLGNIMAVRKNLDRLKNGLGLGWMLRAPALKRPVR